MALVAESFQPRLTGLLSTQEREENFDGKEPNRRPARRAGFGRTGGRRHKKIPGHLCTIGWTAIAQYGASE